MATLNCIIIEDEPLATELLAHQLKGHNQIRLMGTFTDGYSGLKAIQKLNPDLVFLDIDLPKLTGLELLELLDTPPMIIFTTAYNQYAIEAFEKNAIDYLLKPYSTKRLFDAIDKASKKEKHTDSQISKHQDIITTINESEENKLDRIAVKDKSEIHLIDINDIYFLEAKDDYVSIETKEKSFLKNARLKFYEKNLNPKQFIRVHRSYIVNTDYIRKIEPYSKDSYMLLLKDNKKVYVSRTGLQLLKGILNL